VDLLRQAARLRLEPHRGDRTTFVTAGAMSSDLAAGMYWRARSNMPGEPTTCHHKGEPMSDSRAQDRAAIEAVLIDSYQAWEAGDAAGMVANYTEDATAIMTGSLRDSRDVIRESMALGFAGPLKGSSTLSKQLSLRFVGSDAAIVVSESGILFAGDTEIADTGKVNATWVLEKRDGQWLIAAYHNSPLLAAGQ
jgi:uncharacterized protein (TIGR02246 family)